MRACILGSLELWEDGRELRLGGGRQRTLFALLVLHANEIVSTERLIDALWPEVAPTTATKVVQTWVSQLRKVLPEEALLTRPNGYLLRLSASDVGEFEDLVGVARTQEPAQAAHTLRRALALWRGRPYADVEYEEWAQPEIRRLEDLRLAAIEDRIDAELQLGMHSQTVSELEVLVAGHPLRERLRGQLMLALYRSGRQAEALETYAEARRRLVDGLGVEPAAELRQLQRAILAQDRALGGNSRPAATAHPTRERATIRDVASAAGVSIATVSRVLNGRPDVAADTRETVLRVVRDLRFTTNRSARSLSGGRTLAVGITLPLVEVEYFSRILAGAADALYEHDLQVVLGTTLHLRERAATLLGRLTRGTTDGAVLILPEQSSDELDALTRSGFPFVIVDPLEALHEGIRTVSATNALGGRSATEHLLALGHRRIGVITGIPDWLASVERLNGHRTALAAAGIPPDPGLVAESDWAFAGGEAAAASLLDRPEPPTAIFAFNDNMAVGVLRAAQARGLRIPEDLSVVGFDDQDHAAAATPALTTVRQPLGEMGRMAASLLIRLIDRPAQPLPRAAQERRRDEALRIELQTRLIVRNSTAAPRG